MRHLLRIFVNGLIPLVILLGARPALAGSAPISLGEFWTLAQKTRDLVAQVQDAPAAQARAALDAQAARWEAFDRLTLPGESTIALDGKAFVALLRADPPNFPALQERLSALLALRDAWPGGRFSEADVLSLQQILSRPEFQWPEQRRSLLDEWRERILRFLADLFSRILQNKLVQALLPYTKYLFYALGLLAVAAGIAYALRGIRRSMAAESSLEQPGEAHEDGLTARDAFQKAEALSAGGDYRQAVRYLYLSSLLLLDEKNVLRYDRTRTNREVLRSVAHLPELSAPLREVVEVFDRVWYGFQPLDPDNYQRYAAAVARLRQVK